MFVIVPGTAPDVHQALIFESARWSFPQADDWCPVQNGAPHIGLMIGYSDSTRKLRTMYGSATGSFIRCLIHIVRVPDKQQYRRVQCDSARRRVPSSLLLQVRLALVNFQLHGAGDRIYLRDRSIRTRATGTSARGSDTSRAAGTSA